MMKERIAGVGFLAPGQEHILVSIKHPSILNVTGSMVQVAVTIENAEELRNKLDDFLFCSCNCESLIPDKPISKEYDE